MNQKPHPGPHLDADQLSIFVEGADNAREREQVLAHLSECEECRDVVFLMQQSAVTSPAVEQVPKEWIWQRWWLSAGLAGAALAGLIALLVYIRPGTNVPESIRQSAAVEEPETKAHGAPLARIENPTPSAQREKAKKGSRPGRSAISTVRQEPGGAAGSKATNVGSRPAYAGVASPGTKTRSSSGSAAAIAGAAAAPKPEAQSGSDLNSAVVQNLPQTGRNVISLQPPASQPRAQTPTSQASLATQPVLLERSTSQDKTLSGVSGRVTDMTGAVIPKATVALRDASGSTRQVATAADGSFRLTGIPAGRYDLTVTSPGFKSNQRSIDLKPSELAMVQPVLTVGEVTETVEVTSSAPAVETESASVASVAAKPPSRLPVVSSASLGKRTLSLDSGGSLFLSRNGGKSWKKVHPQWTGKAVRIDLTAGEPVKAKDQSEASGVKSSPNVFQLTTDSGAHWTSKDGKHWRPR